MTTAKTPVRNWTYLPVTDRLQESVAVLLAGTLSAGIMAVIFAPALPLLAGGFGIGILALNRYTNADNRAVKKYLKTGVMRPLAAHETYLQSMVDDFTAAAGAAPINVMMYRPDIKTIADTMTNQRIIGLSPRLLHIADKDQLRFALAHEVAHVRVRDGRGPGLLFHELHTRMDAAAVVIVTLLALVSLSAGAGLPALLALGAKGLAAIFIARAVNNLGTNYALRVAERRADRNAIYMTRNLAAAESLTQRFYPPERGPTSALLEIDTHPTLHRRLANLKAAFNESAAYPAPPSAAAYELPAGVKLPLPDHGAVRVGNFIILG